MDEDGQHRKEKSIQHSISTHANTRSLFRPLLNTTLALPPSAKKVTRERERERRLVLHHMRELTTFLPCFDQSGLAYLWAFHLLNLREISNLINSYDLSSKMFSPPHLQISRMVTWNSYFQKSRII